MAILLQYEVAFLKNEPLDIVASFYRKLKNRCSCQERQRHMERGVYLSEIAGSTLVGPVVAGPDLGDSAELFTISEIRFDDSRNTECVD